MASKLPLGIKLNDDQVRAEAEVMASVKERESHVLTGHGGSGKTTFVQVLAYKLKRKGTRIVLTAPTHKAVSVLRQKLRAAGVDDIPCGTIQSLLSLRPRQSGDRQVFVRDQSAKPVTADVVVVDECSMLSESLMAHICENLRGRAVLFVGDRAQLPPVGEDHSASFDTERRSHLDTIVRQAGGGSGIVRYTDTADPGSEYWECGKAFLERAIPVIEGRPLAGQ